MELQSEPGQTRVLNAGDELVICSCLRIGGPQSGPTGLGENVEIFLHFA